MIKRFDYERRYKRRGIWIETRWWYVRLYLPHWPKPSFWWKSKRVREEDRRRR